MKTRVSAWVMMSLLIFTLIITSCKKTKGDQKTLPMRSADPCNAWARPSWQTGPGAIITPEIRDGKASHMLPAKIIYFSISENCDSASKSNGIFINPVLVLTYLEKAELLSKDETYGDFELRLLQACGYGAKVMKKYHGFYPQLVAATYQWRLYQAKNLSFTEAQNLYPFDSAKLFSEVYANYANIMNNIVGSNYSLYPDSKGYYQDFSGKVSIENIQKFLEINNSPLKNDLFNQVPVSTTVINYLNMGDYCE